MKKRIYLFLSGIIISMALLGGCGKTAQEEKVRGDVQAEAEEISGEEQESVQTEDQESPGEEENREEDQGDNVDSSNQNEASDQANQSTGIAFEAQDLEGNTVTESVFAQSKLTMVNVWATYCNPCLSEMPGLGELAGEYDAQQFQIIGIVSDVQEGMGDEAVEYAAALVSQTGADYEHLLLNESLFRAMLGGVSAVPTTFFVDENGEVLDTVVGAMDKSAWKEKIDGLLEK